MSSRIPYIVGNTKGRDHLEFPAINGSGTGLDPVNRQLLITPAEARKWLWRVRQWKVNGSVTVSFHGQDNTSTPASTYSASLLATVTDLPLEQAAEGGGPGDSVATDETDLIEFIGFPITSPELITTAENFGTFLVSNDPSPYVTFSPTISGDTAQGITWLTDGDAMPSFGISFQLFGAPVYWNGTQIQPKIGLSVEVTGNFHSHKTTRSPQSQNFGCLVDLATGAGAIPGFVLGVGNLNVDGHSTPLYYRAATSGSTFITRSAPTVTLTDWTVTPASFWPFKNRLGQPVYDTASGAQLNDPFG